MGRGIWCHLSTWRRGSIDDDDDDDEAAGGV